MIAEAAETPRGKVVIESGRQNGIAGLIAATLIAGVGIRDWGFIRRFAFPAQGGDKDVKGYVGAQRYSAPGGPLLFTTD